MTGSSVFNTMSFLPLICNSFTIPHLYLICWDLPLSSSKLQVESWCKSISGYHLSNGLLSPLLPSTARIVCIVYGNWFFPLLVFDTATSQDITSRPHLYFYPIILPPTLSALITGFFPLPSTSCPPPYQPPITSHKHSSWTWPRLRVGLDFQLRFRVGLTLA